jgi:molybdate transport system substrate-binding protein
VPARPADSSAPATPLARRSNVWWAAAIALAIGACGGDDGAQLTVLAAASLTDVFADLEARYEAVHPGVDVVVSYGGSSGLASQIEQGAPADVFASADAANMERVVGIDPAVDDGFAEPVVFATNELVIAVAVGNPAGVAELDDLARPELVVVLADEDVPAGRYAAAVLDAAGVALAPDSLEQNVRAAAAKVALGEADAAIVYRTDVGGNDALEAVAIPRDLNVIAEYPIAARADDPEAARFVELVAGPDGRAILAEAGFGLP